MAFLALLTGPGALSQTNRMADISIAVSIHDDGSVSFTERRECSQYEGTEQYIVKELAGDIDIRAFSVTDDVLGPLDNVGRWDSSLSRSAKEGRCGVARTSDGVELCWGIGDYGDHTFNVSYTMTNLVKSLDDYDMFFVTLLTDSQNPLPEHVKASIEIPGTLLDTTNARAWAFGYDGDVAFLSGKVIAETVSPFRRDSRMVILLRLDKGILHPVSVIEGDFSQYQRRAFEGSDYSMDSESSRRGRMVEAVQIILSSLAVALLCVFAVRKSKVTRRDKRRMLGQWPSEVQWWRDVPVGGDLAQADWIISRLGEQGSGRRKGSLAAAYILKMVLDGQLTVTADARGRSEFTFGEWNLEGGMPPLCKRLLGYMKEAAGKDNVLQNNEFRRWAMRRSEEMSSWMKAARVEGETAFRAQGGVSRSLFSVKYSPAAQGRFREVYGMKKFLSDFTLIDRRGTPEVGLWREYLIYGALFGIADKVAKDLKSIDPALYESLFNGDAGVSVRVWPLVNSFSDTMRTASLGNTAQQMASRSSGFGGMASFGGGHGSFGGGHGGGMR